MTEKLKQKWLHLYAVAQQIGVMQPWEDFSEADKFTYIWKDKSKTVLFSFIGESAQKCGIACYTCEEDYARARVRLTEKNSKHEPVFMLQNALICLWDDREDLSEESYALIKELGFKPENTCALMCGPPIMIKFTLPGLIELGFDKTQIFTTMELRMKCGVGKCGRCNIGSKYVCKDGPVFRFDELDELPDEY